MTARCAGQPGREPATRRAGAARLGASRSPWGWSWRPRPSVLHEDVAAGAAVECVDAGAPYEQVVAVAAGERVVPGPATHHVVAGASVGCEVDRVGRQVRAVDHVVAGELQSRQPVVGEL